MKYSNYGVSVLFLLSSLRARGDDGRMNWTSLV